MVDDQVENILSEIRERVRAQELPRAPAGSSQITRAAEPHLSSETSRDASAATATEALARIDSYLTVTSRAWDRLPPLSSNRSGSVAQIELWVKRQIKRATHWFTWEQVNFNSAAHHALRETFQVLSAYEQALEEFRAEAEQRQLALTVERAEFESQRAELQAQRAAHIVAQRKEIDARFAELWQMIHERFEQQLEEQRVCFKQLSLEATEAAVREDRARRKSAELLEGLASRVSQLEK